MAGIRDAKSGINTPIRPATADRYIPQQLNIEYEYSLLGKENASPHRIHMVLHVNLGGYIRNPFLSFDQLRGGGEVAFVLASKSCAGGFKKFAQAISPSARTFFGQGGWVLRGLLLAGDG